MYIGFKRIKIQPLGADGTAAGDIITLEGKSEEGATQEATIAGLSSEPIKVHGSNIPYFVSQKGTGDVVVTLKLLDMPYAAEATILGYTKVEALDAQYIGENAEPPYCAIVLESEDAKGNVALFGFFKGKFSKGDLALKTKEGSNFTPDGESYTYSAVISDREGGTNGNSMIKFIGSSDQAEEVEALVFGT